MLEFSPGESWLKLIDLGSFTEFRAKIARIQKRFTDRLYRFSEMQGMGGQCWVFEEEDEEEIVGAVLQVQDNRVYALSQDVYQLVLDSLSRKK